MVKNVVFDMGNVILKYNPDYMIDQMLNDEQLKSIILDRVFNSEEWIKLDQGLISIENAKISMKKDLPADQAQMIDYVMDHWFDYMDEIEGMNIVLRSLKEKGFDIYLLSNASIAFYNYYQNFSSFKYFKGFYISAKHKLIKPDLKIYESFFNAFRLNPDECLFIDDRQENVDGSIQAGMDAIVFDGDLQNLILTLKQRNIL